jgi:hypothetical protein
MPLASRGQVGVEVGRIGDVLKSAGEQLLCGPAHDPAERTDWRQAVLPDELAQKRKARTGFNGLQPAAPAKGGKYLILPPD